MSEAGRQLYYMAPVQNAPAIALLGILSYNLRHSHSQLDRLSVSIADPFVNARRHQRLVKGRSLHDYVPLYWATHTPMQYVVTQRDRTLAEDDLVFFVMDAAQVLLLPGVLTTDGNAASRETNIYDGWGALPCLDWRIIGTTNCYSREYERRKCAEVLVPDTVPAQTVSHIAVRTERVAGGLRMTLGTLTRALDEQGIERIPAVDVRVCPRHYYSWDPCC